MATTLMFGAEDRDSAKRRRRDEYRQDLELQMREREAARQRERLQDMSVNASGWLDPEKSPERFKPLGGVHWTEQRAQRTDRVKPYHTLFLYGREPAHRIPNASFEAGTSQRMNLPNGGVPGGTLELRYRGVHLDPPTGLGYQPLTYATTNVGPNNSMDQVYNFYGTRDLGAGFGGGGGGSIVQPISMPYVDNRPIIVTGQNSGGYHSSPRYVFNPYEHRDDSTARELRSLLGLSNAEKDRLRRENEDFQRRVREELERERRKINDQEADARRRMEELRREAEERRKEAERQRREAERLKKEAETRPKTDPPARPQSKKTMIYYDMNDYRQKLIDERKRMEELLKAGKPVKDIWDIQIAQRPVRLPPPTPKSADRANRDNVRDFNDLKYRDFQQRNRFRNVYPDVPVTNRRLEEQQDALIRTQETTLLDTAIKNSQRPGHYHLDPIQPRRAVSRPDWMDRDLTPFPHVLKKRDKMYLTQSWDGDLDKMHRRNEERERLLAQASSRNEESVMDELRLRRQRPSSADTLTDDTWLRPSSTDIA